MTGTTGGDATLALLAGRALDRLWNHGDLSALADHAAPDVVAHVPELPPVHGTEAFGAYVLRMRAAFPDLEYRVHATIAEGDHVMVRAGSTGTQLGDYDGIPATGRPVAISELVWLTFTAGRITEIWRETNNLAVLDQLGVLPPENAAPLRQLGHTVRTVGRLVALKTKQEIKRRRHE